MVRVLDSVPEHYYPGAIATREYRVTFWQQQVSIAGAWSALHVDLVDAQDVHEVIDWAEVEFDNFTDNSLERGEERMYQLSAKVPGETWMLHLAGENPTIASDDQDANLTRRHPAPEDH